MICFTACGCCVDVCITQRKPSSWKGFTNKAHLDLSWGSLWSMFHYFVPMYFPNATKTCKMIKSATYIKGKFPKFVLKSLLQCLLLLSFLRGFPHHTLTHQQYLDTVLGNILILQLLVIYNSKGKQEHECELTCTCLHQELSTILSAS